MEPRHQELRELHEAGVLTPDQAEELRKYEMRGAYERTAQRVQSGEITLSAEQQAQFDAMNPADLEPGISPEGAALRGFGHELTLGAGDEIAGGIESLFTNKGAGTAIGQYRAADKLAELNYPGHFLGGQLGGAAASMLIPSGLYMRGAARAANLGKAMAGGAVLGMGIGGTGLGKAMLGSAGVGGLIEGIRGFASGEGGFDPRAQGAMVGAGIGALGGGLGPVVGRGIGSAIKGAKSRFAGPRVAGVREPAMRRTMDAFNRSAMARGQTGPEHIDDIQEQLMGLGSHSPDLDDQLMLADVGGELQDAAAVAAKTAGHQRPGISEFLEQRAAGDDARMRRAFDTALGDASAATDAERALTTRARALGEQYDAVLGAADSVDAAPLVDEMINRAPKMPTVQNILGRYARFLQKAKPELTKAQKDAREQAEIEAGSLARDAANEAKKIAAIDKELEITNARLRVAELEKRAAPPPSKNVNTFTDDPTQDFVTVDEFAENQRTLEEIGLGPGGRVSDDVIERADEPTADELLQDPEIVAAMQTHDEAELLLAEAMEEGDPEMIMVAREGFASAKKALNEAAAKVSKPRRRAAPQPVAEAADEIPMAKSGDPELDAARAELADLEKNATTVFNEDGSLDADATAKAMERATRRLKQTSNDPYTEARLAAADRNRLTELRNSVTYNAKKQAQAAKDMGDVVSAFAEEDDRLLIDAETMHNLRSELAGEVEMLKRKGLNSQAQVLNDFIPTLDAHLSPIEGYGPVRMEYADVMNRKDIIDEGRSALMTGADRQTPAALSARILELDENPDDGFVDLYRKGLREAVDRIGGLRRGEETGAAKVLEHPWNRHLLSEVAGPDNARHIFGANEAEVALRANEKRLGNALATARMNNLTDEIAPRRSGSGTLFSMGVGGFNRALDLLRLTPRRRALNETAGRFDARPGFSVGPISKGTAGHFVDKLNKNNVALQVLDLMTRTGKSRDEALGVIAKRFGFDSKAALSAFLTEQRIGDVGRTLGSMTAVGTQR